MGKKPIVLIVNDPSDSAFSHWPYTEVLNQAYKDRFDFYCVAVSIWDQTMANPNYFNPIAEGSRQVRNGHYYSMDDRARRAKNRYIETPYASFPCILDDMVQTIRNLYVNGGGQNHFTIIDIDGKVTARGRSNMQLPTQWINDMEQSLNKTIDSKGKAIEHPPRKNDDYCSYTRFPIPERKYLLVKGSIISVDTEKQVLKLSAKTGKEKKEYTATINKHTRINRNGNVISLGDLKIGDSCSLLFCDETYYTNPTVKVLKMGHRHAEKFEIKGKNGTGICDIRSPMNRLPYNRATCILTSDTGNGKIKPVLIESNTDRKPSNNVWFFGKVEKVSDGGRKISVKQILTDKKEMKGYYFWKQAGDKCKLPLVVQEKMDVINAWHDKPAKERTYTFVLDDSAGVFLNGEFEGITYKNIKAGDFVSIEVNTVQAMKKAMYPNAIRISRKN